MLARPVPRRASVPGSGTGDEATQFAPVKIVCSLPVSIAVGEKVTGTAPGSVTLILSREVGGGPDDIPAPEVLVNQIQNPLNWKKLQLLGAVELGAETPFAKTAKEVMGDDTLSLVTV